MASRDKKTKLCIATNAAIWGGLTLAAITAFAMVGCLIFKGNIFGGFYFWASVPPDFVYRHLIGPESTNPFGSSLLYITFCAAIDGLLGALFCAFSATLWCGVKNGKNRTADTT